MVLGDNDMYIDTVKISERIYRKLVSAIRGLGITNEMSIRQDMDGLLGPELSKYRVFNYADCNTLCDDLKGIFCQINEYAIRSKAAILLKKEWGTGYLGYDIIVPHVCNGAYIGYGYSYQDENFDDVYQGVWKLYIFRVKAQWVCYISMMNGYKYVGDKIERDPFWIMPYN